MQELPELRLVEVRLMKDPIGETGACPGRRLIYRHPHQALTTRKLIVE